jgi:hypothetical protein
MTDKEILDLAAKAGEIFVTPKTLSEALPTYKWDEEFQFYYVDDDNGLLGTVFSYCEGDITGIHLDYWNPLNDDSDSLCLALKLGIAIIPPGSAMGTPGVIKTDVFSDCPIGVVHAPILDSDPRAAARRAIVMAAAELGQRHFCR